MDADPTVVAPAADRVIAARPPAGRVRGVFGVLAVCGVAFGGLCLGVIATDGADPVGVTAAVSSFATAAGSILVVVLAGLARAGWKARTAELEARWSTDVPRAVSAERSRRDSRTTRPLRGLGPRRRFVRRATRVGRFALGAGGIGGVIFMAGVVLRQPCRSCSQRSYGPAGELAIDDLVLAGSIVIGLALALGVACLLVAAAVRLLDADRIRRAAVEGNPSWVPPLDELRPVLLGPSTAEVAGIACSAVGFAVATVTISAVLPMDAETIVASRVDATRSVLPAALLVWLLGAVISTVGAVSARRFRDQVRREWSPGDPSDGDGAVTATPRPRRRPPRQPGPPPAPRSRTSPGG